MIIKRVTGFILVIPELEISLRVYNSPVHRKKINILRYLSIIKNKRVSITKALVVDSAESPGYPTNIIINNDWNKIKKILLTSNFSGATWNSLQKISKISSNEIELFTILDNLNFHKITNILL